MIPVNHIPALYSGWTSLIRLTINFTKFDTRRYLSAMDKITLVGWLIATSTKYLTSLPYTSSGDQNLFQSINQSITCCYVLLFSMGADDVTLPLSFSSAGVSVESWDLTWAYFNNFCRTNLTSDIELRASVSDRRRSINT